MKDLNLQLELNLSGIDKEEEKTIIKYQQATDCIYDAVLQLKSFILDYHFSDIKEEIIFFKEIKPKLISELIFNNTLLNILMNVPPGSSEIQINYYKQYLKEITNYFNKNLEFHQYYRLNSTQYDSDYFVRNKKGHKLINVNNMFIFEPEFSSSHDHIVAQIMANDRLETFIKEKIESINYANTFPHVDNMGNSLKPKLEWTDNKSDLIELIYAIDAKGSINNGKCDIRKIANIFEQLFNVKLPDIYRTYQDIKMRSSQTKYIDSLQTSLQNKIDKDYR